MSMQFDIGLQRPTEVVVRTLDAMQGIVHSLLFNLSLPPYADPSEYLREYVNGSVRYRNPALPIYGKNPEISLGMTVATIVLDNQRWIVEMKNPDEFNQTNRDVVVNQSCIEL